MISTLLLAATAAAIPIGDLGAQFAEQTGANHVACSAETPEIVCYGLLDGGVVAGQYAPGNGTFMIFGADAVDAVAEVAPEGVTTFGDGMWLVGTDIAPGTYRSEVETEGLFDMCYWARLSDLTGDGIIENFLDSGEGQVLVTIEASDVAFETDGCGTWTPIPA